MPKTVVRQNLRLFGQNGDTDSFAKFGSFVAGVPLKTKSIETIQDLDAWVNGWQNAVVAANRASFLEDMNALLYVYGYQLFYMMQEGIVEWNASTTYFKGSIVKRYTTFLEVYVSLTDDNVGNALPSSLTSDINWNLIYPVTASTILGQLVAAQIASVNAASILGQLTSLQIANGAITAGKLGPGAVQAGNFAASAAGNGLVIGGGGAMDMNWDPNSGFTSGDLNFVKRYRLVQGSVTTPQIVTFAGSQTTILNLTQGGVLIGLSARTNSPGSGNAGFQFRVTLDGNLYSLAGYVGGGAGGPAGACSGGALNTGAPLIFTPGATFGTVGQLNLPFNTSLNISLADAGFSDGRWTSTVYYAIGIV